MESPEITRLNDPSEMRRLARWYRNRADAAENPSIWEGRHRTARELERMAAADEAQSLSPGVADKIRRGYPRIDGAARRPDWRHWRDAAGPSVSDGT